MPVTVPDHFPQFTLFLATFTLFLDTSRAVTPPLPWAAYTSAQPLFWRRDFFQYPTGTSHDQLQAITPCPILVLFCSRALLSSVFSLFSCLSPCHCPCLPKEAPCISTMPHRPQQRPAGLKQTQGVHHPSFPWWRVIAFLVPLLQMPHITLQIHKTEALKVACSDAWISAVSHKSLPSGHKHLPKPSRLCDVKLSL